MDSRATDLVAVTGPGKGGTLRASWPTGLQVYDPAFHGEVGDLVQIWGKIVTAKYSAGVILQTYLFCFLI